MRILLTGSSGFLGSALVRYWSMSGHLIYVLARPESRLDDLPSSVWVLRASSPEEIRAAVFEAAPEAIVHTACSYGRKGEKPLDVIGANFFFGAALLQSILDYASEITGPLSFLNTGTVLEPDVSLYALSKSQFSVWGAATARLAPQKLRFIDIRLQQMYGPRDDRSKFITQIIEACRSNEARLALTLGEQRRDFIHIDDVVRAYDRILERISDFAASDSIDVGSGNAITMRSFAELVKKITKASTVLDFGAVPYRSNEPMHCEANTIRLRSLNWRPEVPIATGLTRIINAELID